MKKLIIFLILVFLHSVSYAQIIDLNITKGEKKYSITKEQKRQVKDRVNQFSAQYEVKENFLFQDKFGEHLVWEYANIKLNDPTGRFNPIFEAVKSLYERLKIKFYINNDYEFVLGNYDELAKVAKQTVQLVVNEIKRKTSDQKIIETVQKQLSSIYSNENYLRNKLPQEAILFYSIYGLDFQNTHILEYDTQMPAPFPGLTLPAKGKYVLHKDKNRIEWVQAIDPEASKEFLKKFFSELPKGKKFKDQVQDINISDKAVFKLDKNLTEINELRQTRNIIFGDAKRTDVSIIKRIQ
jgi:hypothetical protein